MSSRIQLGSATERFVASPNTKGLTPINKGQSVFSPRSGRQHKAWGVSPRIESPTIIEPAKRATAVAIPRRKDEPQLLSDGAQRVLKVLRREHELATANLRAESRVTERAA